MMGHVALGSYAPTTAPIVPVRQGAGVVPNTVPYTPYGTMASAPQTPTAQMGKARSGCRMQRMGRAGTRCRCNGKLVKTSRCR